MGHPAGRAGGLPPTAAAAAASAAAAAAAEAATAAGGGSADGGLPTVGAIRLMDWEAQVGAPLVLYSCTVGGRMALVLTSTQPLVSAATAAAVLAAVVKAIEAA